jgi:hypothetical protein
LSDIKMAGVGWGEEEKLERRERKEDRRLVP